MQKVEFLGKLLSFDSKNSTLIFRVDFLSPELVEEFTNLLENQRPIKHSFFQVRKFRTKTYQQQKQFWVDVAKVLNKQDIAITKEVMDHFYDYIKKNIFPAKKAYIGIDEKGDSIYHYYPPNMRDLTVEEMTKVIQDFRSYYEFLNIDWEIINDR